MPLPPIHPHDDVVCLLGRAPCRRDAATVQRLIAGGTILLTGAGGSIGGALTRAIASLGPARLVLLDQNEYAIWRIAQDVAEIAPACALHPVIADLRSACPLRRVLADCRPDLVFHAGALKHVPIVQAQPAEGLLTNAIGTRNLVDAARAAGVRTLVLVSTDKAVAPRSVMGASKRLAEIYGQATDRAAQVRGEALRCVSLRLGNVLGSAGSVVELFQRQIARGGPLTLTHPDMRRFFIAPGEAVGLLLEAAALCRTAPPPPGAVLVPDMATPIRVRDLAERMIKAAGLRPGHDIALRFTGARPGEKLTEAPWHDTEVRHRTAHPGFSAVVPHAPDLALAGRAFDELEAACREMQAGAPAHLALTLVSRLIPGFDHSPEGSADRMRA